MAKKRQTSSSSQSQTTRTNSSSVNNGVSYNSFKSNKGLAKAVKRAEKNAPKYNNQYADLIKSALNDVNKQYTFDAQSNPIFNQYRNDYRLMGNIAAAQSEAQTEALSGGFGTTYGGAVADQQLQGLLRSENDIIPQLAQLEKNNYRQDIAAAINRGNLYNQLEGQDFNRYQMLRSLYDNQREYAYNKWYNNYLANATSRSKETSTDRSNETTSESNSQITNTPITTSAGSSGRTGRSSKIGTVSSYNGLRKKLLGEGYSREEMKDLLTRQKYVTARAKQDRDYNAGWTGGLSKSDPDYEIKKQIEDDVDLDYYEYLNKYYRNKRKGR